MSDDKNRMSDKASEIARNIWLAGVGAYGRAVDEAQLRLERAGVEPPKLFRDLVQAGAALEDEAQQAMEAGQAARQSVEERIQRVRENFNLQRPARGEDLQALHQKIDALSAQIEALRSALAQAGVTSEARPKARAKGSTAADSKPKSAGRAKTATRSGAKPKDAGKAGSAPGSGRKSSAAGGSGTKAKSKTKTKTKTKAESRTRLKARAKTSARAGTTAQPQSGTAGGAAAKRRSTRSAVSKRAPRDGGD